MNLSDYNTGDGNAQTCLFIGESGAGKSIAAAYWRKPGDERSIYFFSCDGRMASVAEWHRGRKDIEFDMYFKYNKLQEKMQSFIDDGCPYQTIVLDPVSNLSSFLMRYSFALRGVIEFNEETGKVEKRTKGKKAGSIDQTTYEDYNVEHRGLEDLIAMAKTICENSKTNIIFTAHLVTTTYYKMGGVESNIRRDILTAGRKIAAFMPTQFDEVYHFYNEDQKWKVKTYNDGIVQARSSFLTMPKDIDWTKKNLFEIMSKAYIRE